MQKPNFFIVGMPRAGTTSLHSYLGEHPEIFMSAFKEPHFFAMDLTPTLSAPKFSKKEYMELFTEAHKKKIVGESSTSYLVSAVAAEEIYHFNPFAKILISIRNPVEQCYSLYCLQCFLAAKKTNNFEQDLETSKGPQATFHEDTLYRKNIKELPSNIKRYQDRFGEENVKIIIFDDLEAVPEKVYRDVLGFLKVDLNFIPDFAVHYANTAIRSPFLCNLYNRLASLIKLILPNKKLGIYKYIYNHFIVMSQRPKMSPELRKKLTVEFTPVVEELEKITGRDLSAWKI